MRVLAGDRTCSVWWGREERVDRLLLLLLLLLLLARWVSQADEAGIDERCLVSERLLVTKPDASVG
jgi:hypothetical protein